ncbi:FAD-dependent monooxygenase [Klebsiella oxytoca]|uniref:FAD-dependent monooxygenase n=1 Tax=Klebsiella oxytoca TaxID=571 RepID=UPI00292D7CE1|nr:FAD-dependent monooxygenase [Klebsiella oxytoca]
MNTESIKPNTGEITIIGGSLAGLTLALACTNRGIAVQVIERSTGHFQGGDSLSIDLSVVAATVGYDPRVHPVLPVVPAYRELTTWPALYGWLRERAMATPGINLVEGKTIASVNDLDDHARITFTDGSEQISGVVIGADGYRSIVRQAITPENPFAQYAGYLVWRGLVEERTLEHPVAWPTDGGLWIDFVNGYRLVAATLPGRDGSLAAGQRQITFAWFDVHRDELLRQKGCLTAEGNIVGTLTRGTIDEKVREELVTLAPQLWPAIWAEAVVAGVRSPTILSGAPIAEFKPPRLVRGALAMIGDAAHVVSPMTGRGYLTGVEDAMVLAQELAKRKPDVPLSAALARYEKIRLPYVQALVNHSGRISAEYRRYAKSGGVGFSGEI